MEEKRSEVKKELKDNNSKEFQEIISEVLGKSESVNEISKVYERHKNELSEPRLTQIGNEFFYLLDKYDVSWVEAFILGASLSRGISDMYADKLNSINLNSKEKKSLTQLYKKYDKEILSKLPLITGLNSMADAILGYKSHGFLYNPLFKTSSNLKKRFETLKKYGFRCIYCGRKAPEVSLELEHLHPKSKGGTDEFDNLAPACWECNRGKRDEIIDKGVDTYG